MGKHKHKQCKKEITEYDYINVPKSYLKLAYILLFHIANLGKKVLDDCESTCKSDNKILITSWNLFISACSCYNNNQYEQAEYLINRIVNDLSGILSEVELLNLKSFLSIDSNQHAKAVIIDKEEPKFFVDAKTGILSANYLTDDYNEYELSEIDISYS